MLNNSRRKTEGKIIFGTGSRGARLEKYLTVNYPFPSGWRSDILVRPGGKIGDICSLVRNKFIRLETTNVKIVFAGGVCNLTTKVRHAGGIEISYHRSDDKIKCLIVEYDSICIYFNSHNVPTYFVTIPPVSIKKYKDFNFSRSLLRTSQYEDTDIVEMQSLLERKDLVYINEYLNALNEKQNISNIRWDRSSCKYVTRKRGKHGQNSQKK